MHVDFGTQECRGGGGYGGLARGLRNSGGCVLLLAALAGCGGPKTAAPPSVAEAVAEFQQQFRDRAATMERQPATARQELELIAESLAGKADAYGEPFAGWLARTREIGEKWGQRPKKAAVIADLNSLEEMFSASSDAP